MKKTEIMLFMMAVMFSFLITVNVKAADKSILSPEFLASGKWSIYGGFEGGDPCSGMAEFTKDGRFTMKKNCNYEVIDITGTYKINGNKLNYTVEKSPDGTLFKKGEKGEATLSDKDSYDYRWYLDDKKTGKIFNHNTKIKDGETVTYGSIEAVSIDKKNGIVTTALKVRESPDASAKEIKFGEANGSEWIELKSLKQGTDLIIYARTKEKVKVGKLNNYWYYVGFSTNGFEGSEDYKGWVFGEFVKIK